MKIHVDTEACTGHARCAAFAPNVYELDDVGFNRTEDQEVPPEFEEEARRGAMACPERAIAISERVVESAGRNDDN